MPYNNTFIAKPVNMYPWLCQKKNDSSRVEGVYVISAGPLPRTNCSLGYIYDSRLSQAINAHTKMIADAILFQMPLCSRDITAWTDKHILRESERLPIPESTIQEEL